MGAFRAIVAGCTVAALCVPADAQSIRTGKTSSGIAYDVRGSGPVVVLSPDRTSIGGCGRARRSGCRRTTR